MLSSRESSKGKVQLHKKPGHEYSSLIASISTIVDIGEPPRVVEEDPDDDVILVTANYGSADYIVTGDRHLLRLESMIKQRWIGEGDA